MRALIYWRYSKEDQSEYSESAQVRACQDYAAAHGLEIVSVYGDAGISGRTIKKRPGFQAALADAQSRHFDVFLVHKLDRMSRNVNDIFGTLNTFDEQEIQFISVTESQFDSSTPQGRMCLGMMAVFAQWYVENLAQETAKGKRERAQQGGWNGALPYGYTTPKKLKQRIEDGDPRAEALRAYLDGVAYTRDTDAVFEPVEIEGYRLAVELYESGQYSDRQIADALNDAGYRTSGHWGANLFTKDTVTPILGNRFYAGFVQYKGEWLDGKHKAAIPLERWERLQAIRHKRAGKRHTTKRTDRVYPLRKVARCAECDTLLRGNASKTGRRYRDPAKDYGKTCSQQASFYAEPVEEQLSEFLSEFELPTDWQARIERLVQARVGHKDPDRAERSNLLAQQKRAKQLFVIGDFDAQEYKAEQARITQALARLRPPSDPAIDLKRAAELIGDLPQLWALATDAERARWVSTVFENIWIRDCEIESVEPKPAFYQVMQVCQKGTNAAEMEGKGKDSSGSTGESYSRCPRQSRRSRIWNIEIIPPRGRRTGGLFDSIERRG